VSTDYPKSMGNCGFDEILNARCSIRVHCWRKDSLAARHRHRSWYRDSTITAWRITESGIEDVGNRRERPGCPSDQIPKGKILLDCNNENSWDLVKTGRISLILVRPAGWIPYGP
jgi:hypothetical protein